MKKVRRAERGQFVIIAALLIATLTLTLTLSIYQTNIHRQELSYHPVNELLLGVTSDMERSLSYSLSQYTTAILNNQGGPFAETQGQQFMATWKQSVLSSYASSGLKINESPPPASTLSFSYWWNSGSDSISFSRAVCTYNIDVDSYGFKGWTGSVAKYVQLQILLVTTNGGQTSLSFNLRQSTISQKQLVPIAGLQPNLIRVGSDPILELDEDAVLTYNGDGNYTLTSDAIDPLEVHLAVKTPDYGIWVSTYHYPTQPPNTDEWKNIYLISGEPASETLVSNQPNNSSGFIMPPFSSGQNRDSATINATVYPNYNITTSTSIKLSMFFSPSAHNAVWTLNLTLGFYYNNNNYTIGAYNFTRITGDQPMYTGTITVEDNQVFVQDFDPRTIPQGSILSITFDAWSGSGGTCKVSFDNPARPSTIELF